MFDDLSDAAVVAAIEETARAEAISGAKRSALVAELASRRRVDADDEERQLWVVDPWAATAAEISAAMGISARAASKEMCIALALRDRLPMLAALYAEGTISSRMVIAITWRTRLVAEGAPLQQIDAAIAEAVRGWGVLAGDRLDQAIDVWVERFDPAAVIRGRTAAQERDFSIGAHNDGAMTTSVWGRLSATDAELLRRRVAQLVAGVCANDPRTAGQRRSDALGVLAAGGDRLACRCGDPNCAAAAPDARAEAVSIHILADQNAAIAPCDGAAAEPVAAHAQPDPPAAESAPRPVAQVSPAGTAVIVGGGVVPTPLLAELIQAGAKLAPIRPPAAAPEPRYRPSARLAAFVRMRDLTCRFPGCNRPADRADIDHTTPHPAGPTCASNTKCLCRLHHLLKTFWIGIGGWADEQLPNGTIIWTSPTGRRYHTKPGSRLFFPDWNTTTAGRPPPRTDTPATASRGLKMPKRRRTRAAERRAHINAERARNQAHLTRHHNPPPEPSTAEAPADSETDCLAGLFDHPSAADHDIPPPF
ncbi:HNH endonuclease signature motif containing protein [Mycobacterium sp. IS-1742]|uniref:HNH endonuclease signature motif containing protein n=1 Tax=Mycobacterium sp. IS-1742 TaxID=1772285 RepID=UPI0009EC04C5|nr:HNH endonuclease signature motif containing protein [Mycobacterium sp. IS-1742]